MKKNFSESLDKIKQDFNTILEVCGNQFYKGCGSYLFDGKTYEYFEGMAPKQNLFFEHCQNSDSLLEIGTYMGHSALIALHANPKIKLRTVDIDARYGAPAITFLRSKFPEADIEFIHSDSLVFLEGCHEKYDLIHIDGHHSEEHIAKEFQYCINLCKTEGKFIFDDVNSCRPLIKNIFQNYSVRQVYEPKCPWTNMFLLIDSSI
jgi:hypothetical protein